MGIKSELHCIRAELDSIAESVERVRAYREELNKFNPFKVGDELGGNGYSHRGKVFVADEVTVSDCSSASRFGSIQRMPEYFIARGFVKKKDGSLGQNRTRRSIKILEVEHVEVDE